MEDDLRTGTPYRISCLRQQPSGVDRGCHIWPIRGYTRFWYTGMASFEKISQAFPRPLPQSPLVFFPALSLALFFARAPLSERLEQATSNDDFHSGCRNVSQCHLKQSFSGLHLPGRSQFTELLIIAL